MNIGGRHLIAGIKPSIFFVVFLILVGGFYLEILPDNMLMGFVIPMVIGGLLVWVGELIPGFTRVKDFLKDFGGVYDEGIENIDLDSTLQDIKNGEVPSLDSNEEPTIKVVSTR